MGKLTEEEILSMVDRHFLDRLTSIDNLIAENTIATKRLVSLLSGAPTKIEVKPSLLTDQLLQELVNLARREKMLREEIVFFTYPRTGGTKTLQAGITSFDLYTGKVTLPDGTENPMSTSLEEHSRKNAHSVYIEADQEITVKVGDAGGEHTVDAKDYFLSTYLSFNKFYVTATEDTKIKFWACTNPEAILKKLKLTAARTILPIARTTDTQNLSVAALSKTTALTTRFKLLSVLVHLDAATSPTITVTLDSKDGVNYDTILKKDTLSSNTDYVFMGGDEYKFQKEDQIKVDITSVSATCYLTILTEEV